MRGPVTDEEKNGQASRVEVYICKLCSTETTFPRYNSPRALFKSRRGRCGEFANLFGTYCRALGFDTRYILDFTDHVWVEVWSVRQQRWLHSDSCEGLIDRPNMYEQGWGKKLNYCIGATHDSVADVTRRYTRKLFSDEFQARRREFAPDETTSEQIFLQMNGALRQSCGKGRAEDLEKRGKAEDQFFSIVQSSGVWDVDYREGRISGSLAWKAARKELREGKNTSKEKEGNGNDEQETHSFHVESFYPSNSHDNLIITVQPPTPSTMPVKYKSHPECITVNRVPCAATLTNGISVVVIDETSGCILQSRAYSHWSAIYAFLHTVPDGRIVALFHLKEDEQNEDKQDSAKIQSSDTSTATNYFRLGGFDADMTIDSCFLFLGQLGFHPKWATCTSSDGEQCIKVSLQLDSSIIPKMKLRSETNSVPSVVSYRLPETTMPLKTQLEATNYQKRLAFNTFMDKTTENTSIIGYSTRPNAPVYVLDSQSFPFQRAEQNINSGGINNNDTSWVTYHYLPEELVSDDDIVEEDKTSASAYTVPKFDIPIADDYFLSLLGNQLLAKHSISSTPTLMKKSSALANTRLVALYFSASWCGPCRGFTPMLIECYNHLKEEVAATHGLEIVFISLDRDEGQFDQYYSKMPFLALPYSNRQLAKHAQSVFGVRGIPSLVVIDSISGRMVASEESKRDVHQACQRGEQAIESLFKNWLDKVPAETKSMVDILALSCSAAEKSGNTNAKAAINAKAELYLVRKNDEKEGQSKDDFSTLVKSIFTELTSTGMSPNAAATEAMKRATAKQNNPSTKLEEGTINGTVEKCSVEPRNETIASVMESMCQLNDGDKGKVGNVLSTAKKYVVNVLKDPSNPRFRNFKLSNKVFDSITSAAGSIDVLRHLGFAVYSTEDDFYASIPLPTNLSLMLDNLSKEYSS